MGSSIPEKREPRQPINAGVGGYGVDQIVLTAERLLPVVSPQMVIVGIYQETTLPTALGVGAASRRALPARRQCERKNSTRRGVGRGPYPSTVSLDQQTMFRTASTRSRTATSALSTTFLALLIPTCCGLGFASECLGEGL
jgi:hypothetical protein